MLVTVRFVDESTGFLAPASVEDFRADLEIGYATAAAMFITYGIGGVLGNLVVAAMQEKTMSYLVAIDKATGKNDEFEAAIADYQEIYASKTQTATV